MANNSDQIEDQIAATRARMSTQLDDISSDTRPSASGVTSSLTEQIRRRPLLALGLSMVAGSLLQDTLSGKSGSSSTMDSLTARTGDSTDSMSSRASYSASSAADTAKNSAQSAGQAVSNAAQQAKSTTADAASTIASKTSDAAATATDAARTAADTATEAARSVASTAGDVANQAMDTASDAASTAGDAVSKAARQTSSFVGDFGTNVSEQIHQRPLAALGVAIGTGMMLQPTLAPYVSKVTDGIRDQASKLGDTVGGAQPLTDSGESDRIREALVPATVGRAKEYATQDLRDMLDSRLEPVVGQTSLRAGVVAAITEKAEAFIDTRLPSVLDKNLTGTRGIVVTGIVGAVLKARDQAKQGQGQTSGNVRENLVTSITDSSADSLKRYFPEFRERYEGSSTQ